MADEKKHPIPEDLWHLRGFIGECILGGHKLSAMGGVDDLIERIVKDEAELTALRAETHLSEKDEKTLRFYLWMNHGHRGQYGYDGEMRCTDCAGWGIVDYKRAPLGEVIQTAASMNETSNLKELELAALASQLTKAKEPRS